MGHGEKRLRTKSEPSSDILPFIATLAILLLAAIVLAPLMKRWNIVPLAVVSSWSMEPTLHVGDIVVVVKKDKYLPGDIALYRSQQGTIIIHRVLGETLAGSYVMKGDANAYEDSYQPKPEEMVGKAAVVVPYVGAFRLLLPIQLP
ncbi:MAG: signal peptidase I [Thermofilum sp.]